MSRRIIYLIISRLIEFFHIRLIERRGQNKRSKRRLHLLYPPSKNDGIFTSSKSLQHSEQRSSKVYIFFYQYQNLGDLNKSVCPSVSLCDVWRKQSPCFKFEKNIGSFHAQIFIENEAKSVKENAQSITSSENTLALKREREK